MPDVMRRLEGGMKSLIQQDAAEAATPAEPAPAPVAAVVHTPAAAPEIADAPPSPAAIAAAVENVAARTPARGRILTVVAKPVKVAESTGQLALKTENAELQAAEEAAADETSADPADEPEAVEEIAMSGAGDIVADPAEEPEAEAPPAAPSPKEQELVNALLDAEQRLIEAEALAGAANANSPVAEIIRRISQRTREITGPGAPQA
jgi:hypothetical protein